MIQKMVVALLVLCSCVDDSSSTEGPCGAAPVRPSISAVPTDDGNFVAIDSRQYDVLQDYFAAVDDWTVCVSQ